MCTILIVPPDLRQEETIIQIAYGLNCVQKTINTVFERIDSRITQNNDKVEILTGRIKQAQTKIESLIGVKKSIKIYSPAQFPTSHGFLDIPLTFPQSFNKSIVEKKGNQNFQYDMKSQVVSLTFPELQDKLRYFHVRSTTTPGLAQSLESATKQVNLQSLEIVDKKIKSVNSMLLLNKIVRVDTIKSDETLKSWKRSRYNNQKMNSEHTIENKKLLEPAPHSLTDKSQCWHRLHIQRSLCYTPRLNKAPEINLPLHLPDLPGIADDIQFLGKDQQQIAPSLFIDNLPDFAELQPSINILSNLEYSNNQQLNLNFSLVMPAPAPPPPPPAIPSPTVINSPPLPLLSEPQFTGKLEKISSNFNSAHILNCSARSDLMDAIRKAGGIRGGRLRAATDVGKAVLQLPKNLTSASGDLMVDLHNKLLMRRKGISGHKDRVAAMFDNNNKVINHLFRIIPPPPTVCHKSKQSTDEDDEDKDWID